jgi:hypothetical protein
LGLWLERTVLNYGFQPLFELKGWVSIYPISQNGSRVTTANSVLTVCVSLRGQSEFGLGMQAA